MADEIDDVPEERGGPSGAPAPAAPRPAPAAGTKLDPTRPDELVRTVKGTRYADVNWNLRLEPAPGYQEVAIETDIYANGRAVTYILKGNGQRYPDRATEGVDPQQRQMWETAVKDADALTRGQPKEGETRGPQNGPTREVYRNGQWVVEPNPLYQGADGATSVVEIAGKRYAIQAKRNQDGTVSYTYTDLQTNQPIDALPAPPEEVRTQFIKGGDGKTYVITIGADGKVQGPPVDSGLPADAKADETYNVAGVGLVRVDRAGKASVVYAAPKEPNVKIEKDQKTGRWYEIKTDPRTGSSTVKEIRVERAAPSATASGSGSATASAAAAAGLGEIPDEGKIAEWLWAQSSQLQSRVEKGDLTIEEADRELDRRIKFAETLVAERQAERQAREKDLDREQKERETASANWRQGLSSGTSLYTSVAPTAMKMGGEMLPGNGRVAAEGFLAMLAAGKQFAEALAGPRPTTTVAPDGTVTVNQARPAAPTLTPGVQSLITGALGLAPSWLTPTAGPTAAATDAAANAAQIMANPVFRPQPPVGTGAPVDPASIGAPEPPAAAPPIGTGAPATESGWLARKAYGGGLPPAPDEPDTSYLDGVADDPTWRSALEEARRRDRMAVRGVAA